MTNFNIIILFTLAEFLLMCNSNYGSIMHHFDIFDFENTATLKAGSEISQGYRNKLVPSDSLPMVY